jgi:hypothetical protein
LVRLTTVGRGETANSTFQCLKNGLNNLTHTCRSHSAAVGRLSPFAGRSQNGAVKFTKLSEVSSALRIHSKSRPT